MPKYNRIVVLTGAGISAESGIKTFRDQNGLWENHRIEDVASYEGFLRNPDLVHHFYNERRRQLQNGPVPNQAHLDLAIFARQFPGEILLVTQNVDDLHQRAGQPNFLAMHGELLKARCQKSGKAILWTKDTTSTMDCPQCGRQGCLRPHIVWFGEMPLLMPEIEASLKRCDLFVAVGTSGLVYPAAMFVQWARSFAQAHTVEINLAETQASDFFHETITGPASREIARFLSRLS